MIRYIQGSKLILNPSKNNHMQPLMFFFRLFILGSKKLVITFVFVEKDNEKKGKRKGPEIDVIKKANGKKIKQNSKIKLIEVI